MGSIKIYQLVPQFVFFFPYKHSFDDQLFNHRPQYLGNRFGTRSRPYIAHTAKALSVPLMAEFQTMWQSQIDITATHPFRGMTSGNRDVYVNFMFTHTLVERWREALLWSWVVGKIGPLGGRWGVREREMAWQLLGGDKSRDDIVVKSTYRSSARPEEIKNNLEASGHSLSGKTEYLFGE